MTIRSAAAALACCLLLAAAGCSTAPSAAGTDGAATTAGSTPAAGSTTPTPPGATPAGTAAAGTAPPDGVRATVVEVVDGDTPEVYGENTPGEFEGVPDTEAGRSCLDEYGERASAYAERQLTGETVTLTFDANEPRRGYYDRLLVYVRHDDREFNRGLVRRGLARVYDSSFEERERYYAIEEAAMADGRGLWTCRDGTAGTGTAAATPAGTATAAGEGVVVAAINADADGSDGENLNDEFVVLRNRGGDPVDLSGWTLADDAGHEYAFPDGATLAPGATLTLHVGAGADTDSDLYWGRASPVLNNGGETVTLRDDDGTVVAERST